MHRVVVDYAVKSDNDQEISQAQITDHPHLGKSGTIGESNQASDVCKAHYA